MQTRVLVSGASIAGPALAHWLDRFGFDVTVVEKAPAVRPGGQAVDFKGAVHRTVLERTGILDAVRAAAVPSPDGVVVDAAGRTIATVPGAFGGGEINVPRGDVARVLHDLTAERVTYVFGDSVSALDQRADGVHVTFEHGEPRTYDLVVGADGIHSNVRRLAFGPEPDFVRHLGYSYVLTDLTIDGADEVAYSEPGRTVLLGSGKAPAFFVFASDASAVDRGDVEAQKATLLAAFAGAGWRVPELMAQVPAADEVYLDAIARVRADRWSSGRVVLLGDAAWGNTLGGYGTGLALVGAYVLAGELALADGDHERALARFEERFRDYASISEKVNAGRILAPRTRLCLRLRNLAFSTMALAAPLLRLLERPAADLDLPDYEALLADRAPEPTNAA
ncbi:2-polyprenyl-6-methoxyphenol hydroxylase [Microlunatus sagamiharensis]|uniref:2-polyprenyl-6-methoxyphenol hydroxylase n=1 Tax=Microlunatus sagamiharensis TaxID=546874 RepID=A0A1H2MJG1_9ACTN|nr:FAD-dependent monooxygenase [Microlunatus sagamiharensis]SDU93393.1 2-polyprenyl-6-methoxyphenol hydroxylase [Microlunatus sagamiharensis]